MNKKPASESDERALLKLYMDLTGATESGARSVLMNVCAPEEEECDAGQDSEEPPASDSPLVLQKARASGSALLVIFWFFTMLPSHGAVSVNATNAPLGTPLSLADAVNIALKQNPVILRAQKDIEATEGVVLQTRAVAIPKVAVGGSLSTVEESDIDIVRIPGAGTFGQDKNWNTQVRVVQSLYEGGRIASSLRTARLQREQSKLNYDAAVSDAVLEVELAYFAVLLAEQQIVVQEASVELLTRELADTTRRFEAGTVPRFNVLRAEVELANARPRLIRARNSYRVSKNNLANLLGFHIPRETVGDIPLKLSGKLEALPYSMDLAQALDAAQQRRPELMALVKTQALRGEQVVTAKSGWKPELQVYGGYDAHNSQLTRDLDEVKHGWIAGAQMNWNIFDGMLTQGRIKEAQALRERSQVDLDDASRRVDLEVRTAFSNFIEAEEVLKSQEKVLEQAEESLRLANARIEAGSGTQLDVLSAQTALTEARTTQIMALHDYAAARARLERAVGMILQQKP
jgi:outer membrane protein